MPQQLVNLMGQFYQAAQWCNGLPKARRSCVWIQSLTGVFLCYRVYMCSLVVLSNYSNFLLHYEDMLFRLICDSKIFMWSWIFISFCFRVVKDWQPIQGMYTHLLSYDTRIDILSWISGRTWINSWIVPWSCSYKKHFTLSPDRRFFFRIDRWLR